MFRSTRAATVFVAASDADERSRTEADYVCDGTGDDVEIQAALDSLPSLGGSVYLSEGNFSLDNQLSRAIDNISIVGSGMSTKLSLDDSTAVITAGSQTGWSFSEFNTDAGGVTLYIDTVRNHWKNGVRSQSIVRQVASGWGWVEETVNSGVASQDHRSYSIATGATANSTSLTRMQQEQGFSRGQRFDVIDFDKTIIWTVRITPAAGTNLGLTRITFGKAQGDDIGNLANKGFGWHIVNLSLAAIAHDGTDLSLTATGDTLTATTIYDLKIVSRAGTVYYYLDDVLVVTSTSGPTGVSTADDVCFQVEARNSTDAANQQISFWDMQFEEIS